MLILRCLEQVATIATSGVAGDPYGSPGTEVLRDLAGIRDLAVLEQFERRVTWIWMDQPSASAPTAKATVEHVQ